MINRKTVNHTNQVNQKFSTYDQYLTWLKTTFFNDVRSEATGSKPVLTTGFITDKNGVIAVEGKVPLEIANEPDWQAVVTFWSSSDVFVTGMKYLSRVCSAIEQKKAFQNILFPYDDYSFSSFLNQLRSSGVNFYPELAKLRLKNGLSASPDIFIATTDLIKYASLLNSSTIKKIIRQLKSLGRDVVVIKNSSFSKKERYLADSVGLDTASYTSAGKMEGQAFIQAIIDYGRQNNKNYLVIANTTGPSIKKLFEEAAESGFRFYLEVVVVDVELKANEDVVTRFCLGNPVEYLKTHQYRYFIKTPYLPAVNVKGEQIRQSFNIFKKIRFRSLV